MDYILLKSAYTNIRTHITPKKSLPGLPPSYIRLCRCPYTHFLGKTRMENFFLISVYAVVHTHIPSKKLAWINILLISAYTSARIHFPCLSTNALP